MLETPDSWDLLSAETIAECRVFRVEMGVWRRRSDGREASFFRLDNPDWVNIIPLTAGRHVVLIEQFRQGTREIELELPGGMVDRDEDPMQAARRELAEETGLTSAQWTYLGKSHPNPAYQHNWIHHFLAEECATGAATAFDEHESITVRKVPLQEISEMILNGSITHSLVVSAFYFFDHYNRYHGSLSS